MRRLRLIREDRFWRTFNMHGHMARPTGTAVAWSIYDSGVARPNLLPASFFAGYYYTAGGSIAFGSSPADLYYLTANASAYVFQLTVDSSGVTEPKSPINQCVSGGPIQYDNGRLYLSSGVVLDGTTGNQLGQFFADSSVVGGQAVGPIASDSSLGRAWVVPTNGPSPTQLVAFDENSFNPIGSLPLPGIGTSSYPYVRTADLIRWGQNGLAFHTQNQVYVIQSPLVKDESVAPADLSLNIQSPATAPTGTPFTYTYRVNNQGPGAASGITLTGTVPSSLILGAIQPSQGSCYGVGEIYCDLGSLATGSSATVQITVTPTTAGTVDSGAQIASVSFDPTGFVVSCPCSFSNSGANSIPMPTNNSRLISPRKGFRPRRRSRCGSAHEHGPRAPPAADAEEQLLRLVLDGLTSAHSRRAYEKGLRQFSA